MELFKFDAPGAFESLTLSSGQMINGLTSARWTEKYSDVGDFEFKAKLSSGLKDFLPTGTLVSHSATLELGIVENCEINETQDEDPDITITGRMFVAYLDQRVAGLPAARTNSIVTDFVLAPDILTTQIQKFISRHVGPLADDPDKIVGLNISRSSLIGESVQRPVTRGPLLAEVLKLLAEENLGIRTIRKNPFGVLGNNTETFINIYQGQDKSDRVVYSTRTGSLYSVDYLFSNKSNKNSALVLGRFVQVVYDTGLGYQKRHLLIDGSDIDGFLTEPPSGLGLDLIVYLMNVRAQQVIRSANDTHIARADVDKNNQYRYRLNYNLGDIVSVAASYGVTEKMRIVEYTEIEDETGESGHPTLAVPSS